MLGMLLKEMKEMRKEMSDEREEAREEIKRMEERMIEREERWVARVTELESRIVKMEKRRRERRTVVTGGMGGGNLSEKEVGKIKEWMLEQERKERECNIIIRGVRERMGGWEGKEWTQNFLKERLGVSCKVEYIRISGPVIVARIENKEKKNEIMTNKSKLKGTNFFIENDLSWEERKRQKSINRWAREQRGKGEEVKIGVGRVKVRGIWRKWEEMEDGSGKKGKVESSGVGEKKMKRIDKVEEGRRER